MKLKPPRTILLSSNREIDGEKLKEHTSTVLAIGQPPASVCKAIPGVELCGVDTAE